MKNRTNGKHMIDLLFPIFLFFVLALSALLVITLSAKIYENTAGNSYRNHQARIALSYISEKVHQSDQNCFIRIGKLDNCDALIFEQTFDGKEYATYVYFHENALRELFAKKEIAVSPDDGKSILKLQDFSMEEIDETLFYFSCTDSNGLTSDSYISIRPERN